MSDRFSLLARARSVTHAWSGLKAMIIDEHNARVHLTATVFAIALAAWLRIERWEWLTLIIVIALVWITEALNTALENLADHACATHDPLIGKCKDVAATAVLLAAVCAALCGAIIFSPYLLLIGR